MAKKMLTALDMTKLEIQNQRIHNLASAPGSPVEGLVYYDTVTHATYVWNGSAWRSTDAAKLTDGSIPNTALATNPLARANHTGTQAASTISDFDTQVRTSRLDQMAAPTGSVAFNSQKITGLADPTAGTDAANKQYVDNAVAGLSWKEAVRCATTANITLSGLQTLDGVTVVANDRVLVKNQSTASGNGIYLASSGAWTRATDADSSGELDGAAVMVQEGTTLSDTQWVLTTNAPITVGSTSLTFSQFGGGNTYAAGNGLGLAGNVFSVTAHTGISVTASGVAVDTSSVVRKFALPVGNGSATAYTVTHNLNTRDVTVGVYDATTYEEVGCDIVHVDVNSISVTFAVAPAMNAYRVVVHG